MKHLHNQVAADGAAALLLASERSIIENNIKPLARLMGIASVGVDPVETGLGAVPAIRRLLEVMKLEPADVDLFEVCTTVPIKLINMLILPTCVINLLYLICSI